MKNLLFAACLVLAGCDGGGAEDTADVDICEDAPTVTYASFGDGFVQQHCQSCHGSGIAGDDRNGAPNHVIFDTEDDVEDLRTRILARATGRNPTMPPAGGVDEEDRYLLEVWLSCE